MTKIYSVQIEVDDAVTPEQLHESLCTTLQEQEDSVQDIGMPVYVKDGIDGESTVEPSPSIA